MVFVTLKKEYCNSPFLQNFSVDGRKLPKRVAKPENILNNIQVLFNKAKRVNFYIMTHLNYNI